MQKMKRGEKRGGGGGKLSKKNGGIEGELRSQLKGGKKERRWMESDGRKQIQEEAERVTVNKIKMEGENMKRHRMKRMVRGRPTNKKQFGCRIHFKVTTQQHAFPGQCRCV